jgi:hypothetical protein
MIWIFRITGFAKTHRFLLVPVLCRFHQSNWLANPRSPTIPIVQAGYHGYISFNFGDLNPIPCPKIYTARGSYP